MSELISIIVPIYNVEKYLRRCVDSVLNQSYWNLQIILVDDGSPDGCGKICDEYAKSDKRIIVIHKENGGLSSARNAGLDIADGEYIGFVDSDDYIEPDMYEKLLREMKKEEADICICSRYMESESGKKVNYAKSERTLIMDSKQALKRIYSFSDFDMAAWDKLYRANLFQDIRYPLGKINEDYYTTPYLFMKSKKILYLPKPLYHYIQRKGSITKSSEIRKDGVEAGKFLINFFEANYPNLVYIGKTSYVFSYIEILNKYISQKRAINNEIMFEAVNVARDNWRSVFRNGNISILKKTQVMLLALNINLYRVAFIAIQKNSAILTAGVE